ncbi:MAG: hypothetical protein ACRDV2_04995, partial [Actinomycetes bacterium]
LYSVLPAEFIAARDARAKQVRSTGDEELYAQIKALRRPSAAAWLVNLLARSDQGFDQLSDLSHRLRDAQTQLDAQTMKELGRERSRVVADLVERAADLARGADPQFRDSDTVRDQVTSTLIAAIADPSAEAAVTSGRLVSPLSYAGFGEVDLTDAVATPLHVVREQTGKRGGRKAPKTDEPATRIDRRALTKARTALDRAEQRLDDAEEALDEARSRRHQARLAVERAQHAVEELENPGG